MEDIKYADGQGHPARVDQQRLAGKLLVSFRQIIRRARREAGEPALEESDVEAVGCEEAARRPATQERLRRRSGHAGATQELRPEVPRGPELTSWTPRTRILAGSGIFAASTASS